MRSPLILLLLAAPLAFGQVYTYIDAEGNRVFTDKPRSSNAERVMLAPSNSVELSQLYRDFRGKDPSVEPLLEFRGLK